MDLITNIKHNSSNTAELKTLKDEHLPSLISSLQNENQISTILRNVSDVLKFLPVCDIAEVEEEIFVHVMPIIYKSIQRAYNDNITITDTCDDEMVGNIIKENLQAVLNFIQHLKSVLDFISENSPVSFKDISSVPYNVLQSVFISFEHCKNSKNIYKSLFESTKEIFEIFVVNQELHCLLIKMLDSHVTVEADDVALLNRVLEIICDMSDILSGLNIKSSTTNWKGYTSISQKFASELIVSINAELPMKCLCQEIQKNLESLCNSENDEKFMDQTIKITSFLIKVVLKFCNAFRETCYRDILKFCYIIHSFTPDYYKFKKLPDEYIEIIDASIFKCSENFFTQIILEAGFQKIFVTESILNKELPYGCLYFTNVIVKTVVLHDQQNNIENCHNLITAVLDCLNLCSKELFYKPFSNKDNLTLYDQLVVNITKSILCCTNIHSKIEHILLKNILQDCIMRAMLAIDLWQCLLRHSSEDTQFHTLISLLKNVENLDFGRFTSRPEIAFLKILMQRIFKLLPDHLKIEIVYKYPPKESINVWKMLEFEDFPNSHGFLIEKFATNVVEQLEILKNEDDSDQFARALDCLDMLSTINFKSMGFNNERRCNAAAKLWDYNIDEEMLSNNMFRHFIRKICKITSATINDFGNDQIILVLNQLQQLSPYPYYKVFVCDILSPLHRHNRADYGQEQHKILGLISSIIYPSLLQNTDQNTRRAVLEVIKEYGNSSQYEELVKCILKNAKDMQVEIFNFLQGKVNDSEPYWKELRHEKFPHECIKWKIQEYIPPVKKFKSEVKPVNQMPKKAKLPCALPLCNRPTENNVPEPEDDISTVLSTIKNEITCLNKVLKKEQLTPKHMSDIRIVISKLQNLL